MELYLDTYTPSTSWHGPMKGAGSSLNGLLPRTSRRRFLLPLASTRLFLCVVVWPVRARGVQGGLSAVWERGCFSPSAVFSLMS
ncbi:unnamed protein product [Parajaminaea phylloscopi]